MNFTSIFLVGFFVLSLNSCINKQQPTEQAATAHFYDVPAFFQQQIQQLSQHQQHLRKTIEHNGKKEIKEFDTIDWKSELALFAQININKPIWWDKYKIDSLRHPQTQDLVRLHYVALDKKLPIQSIDIQFVNREIMSISIINHQENALYNSDQFLTYQPQKGYSIIEKQHVALMKEQDYHINVEFIP